MNLDNLRDHIPEFTSLHKKTIFTIFTIAIGLSVFLFFTSSAEVDATGPTPRPVISIEPVTPTIFVDVAGKVKRPGVYPFLQGARAIDAINAAGGAKAGVNLSDINLAHILFDGEQIVVGYVEPPSSRSSSRSSSKKIRTTGTININRATRNEFDSLIGIGPVIAARIITYREKNGPFLTIEDIRKVSGIGVSKFNEIKDRLRI